MRLLKGASHVSCLRYYDIANLVERISGHASTSIYVPPAWGFALRVIDSLRDGLEPVRAARAYLELPDAVTTIDNETGTAGLIFTTKLELFRVYQDIMKDISGQLLERGQTAVITNWEESALDDALWIRWGITFLNVLSLQLVH